METSYYSNEELINFPFKSLGDDVLISRKCSIYSPEKISIGNHVRIDDFCILSGDITLGSFIHISAYAALYGRFGIVLEDYTTVSAKVLIFSQSDDYSGSFLTNPMVPEQFTNVGGGLVTLERFSIIGAGSIVLPGITLREGSAIGAMSLVNKDIIDAWSIYSGIPAVFIKKRKKDILEIVKNIHN